MFVPFRLVQAGRSALAEPRQLIPLHDPVWIPPEVHGGMLWILSGTGKLYCYVPGAPCAEAVADFGAGFGHSPFLIREVSRASGKTDRDLWLLAPGQREIKAYGLLDGRMRTVVRLSEPDEILADCLQRSTAIVADTKRVYALRRNGSSIFLEAWDFLKSAVVWSMPVPAEDVSGAALAGDLLFAYSQDRLTGAGPVSGGANGHAARLDSVFPAGFEPQMGTPSRSRGPRPCPGRPAFFSSREWLYLPGRHRNAPALLAVNARGGLSRAHVLRLESEGVYRQNPDGLPTWTADGRMLGLAGEGFVEIFADAQIDPQHPGFSHSVLRAAFVETTEGEKFRIYAGRSSFDYPVSSLPGFDACLDICGVGDALVLVYTDCGDQARLAVWRA